jgi:hypothetical protein
MRPLATVAAVPPSIFAAIGLALRALAREPWLVAVGMLVGMLRRAAVWPAWAVAWALLARAVVAGARGPLDPTAPAEALLATLASPRFLSLVAGLWLAGAAIGAALRVAFLAGALPALGGAMASAPAPRFASGVAYGFPRVLATAALGLVLDVSAGIFGGTLALAAARISWRVAGGGGSVALAAAVALALTLAIAVPLALSTVADAAVARSALGGEGPGTAFAGAGARFLRRPATFLLGTLAFSLAGVFGPGLLGGAGSLLTGFAQGTSALLLLGPNLMLAIGAALVAAALDLAWLGTVAALACAEVPGAGGGGAAPARAQAGGGRRSSQRWREIFRKRARAR